jgi:ASC-1-like (ASCH) protein
MKTIYIKKDALTDILNNNKIYEIRINNKFFKKIKKGEICIFKDTNRNIKCSIEEIIHFNTFEHMLSNLDYRKLNSRTNSNLETLELYKAIYKYINNSVVAFKIKKID